MAGVILQLPLPAGLELASIIDALDPRKDLDGIHPINAGLVSRGAGGFAPSCAEAAIEILKRAGIPMAGRPAVVVGRSNVVGRPAQLLLIGEDATVTVCHRKTRDLDAQVRQAEIVIVAAGVPGLIHGDAIQPGAAVIDCGINVLADGTIVGDVDQPSVLPGGRCHHPGARAASVRSPTPSSCAIWRVPRARSWPAPLATASLAEAQRQWHPDAHAQQPSDRPGRGPASHRRHRRRAGAPARGDRALRPVQGQDPPGACSTVWPTGRTASEIIVTAITPTPLGEGKTTTTIGLAQGLNRLGVRAAVRIRQPSLGPVFGIKGGGAGGGYSQVLPMEDINLHFTGDIHAVTAAHDLGAAFLDNHLLRGNDAGHRPGHHPLAARPGCQRPRPAPRAPGPG